ncbi:hypothetical protein ROP_53680 [Rhodococcus opacus B4]|uniref:Uncharacterized protein n=1 Tax=Rhodococcus opacus (strain B4) TaxID=632772 RepID=C1AVC5_RHOOB|nr:hypothetical protein ROP_53680 [Rhodococcus opacus B4]
MASILDLISAVLIDPRLLPCVGALGKSGGSRLFSLVLLSSKVLDDEGRAHDDACVSPSQKM